MARDFLAEPSMDDAERFRGPRYELGRGRDELAIELSGPAG